MRGKGGAATKKYTQGRKIVAKKKKNETLNNDLNYIVVEYKYLHSYHNMQTRNIYIYIAKVVQLERCFLFLAKK